MIDRRTFSTLLAGTVAAPRTVWSQAVTAKTVFYASGGPELNLYDVDIAGAALRKHSAVTLPANVQYAWPHPSKRYFYVVSSSGGPGVAGTTHVASAFRIDPASGALAPHGEPQSLPSRPIHCSVDRGGEYLLTAYNAPSNVTVHRIKGDGTLGDIVSQPEKLDAGIYAHQIRTTPANRTAILVARGNNADGAKPEDPGALKLYAYKLDADGAVSRDPLFVKDTLADPANVRPAQGSGAIHVHPNGRFVYLTNRNQGEVEFQGKKVFNGGENNVAVFAIDQRTGEPNLVQTIEGHGIHLRNFGIDPSGRVLVASSIRPIAVREGNEIKTLTAGLMVYRVGDDGKLAFVRKYDVDTGKGQQFWSGMVSLG